MLVSWNRITFYSIEYWEVFINKTGNMAGIFSSFSDNFGFITVILTENFVRKQFCIIKFNFIACIYNDISHYIIKL
jgi:hypothetical protein